MKTRYGMLAAIIAGLVLTLAYCGGGGATGVLGVIPEGDYHTISGSAPWAKYNSPFYQQYADEVDSAEDAMDDVEDVADDMGIELERYRLTMTFTSEDAEENLTYYGGPITSDDFEDYCDDELNWQDIDEEEENGVAYWVADNDQGFLMAAGGVLRGHEDGLEDVIGVMTSGGDKLLNDRDFQEAQPLVDFNATVFNLTWDEVDSTVNMLKSMFRQIDDDEDLMDALDDLEAIGVSTYWRGDLETVLKARFKNDAAAETIQEFLNDEKDEIFEQYAPGFITRFFQGEDVDTDDAEDLAAHVTVRRNGAVLEVRFSVTWEQMAEFLD